MKDNALVRLWPYARPHAWGLGLSLLVGLLMLAPGLAIPGLTGAVVDALRAGDRRRVWAFALAVLVLGGAEAVLMYARRHTAAIYSIRMERDLRNDLYRHLQALPVSFHDGWQSGQLLSRAMSDIATIRRFVGFAFIFLLINAVQFAVVATVMIRIHGGLALITGAMAVPIALLTLRFDLRYHDIARRVQDDQGDLTTIVEESATGIRIVKAFGRGPLMSARFRRQTEVLHDSSMAAVRLRAGFWSVLHLLPAVNLGAVIAIGGRSVAAGSMTVGELTAFVGYLLMMTWPIRSIGWILSMGEEARTGAERLFEVLETEPAIADRPGARAIEHVRGRVRLEGVGFRYPGSEDWVLRDVDLEIMPGETLAIVGVTGSGKTTLASLVPRLYDPTRGRITIDGVDVREIALSSLRRHIGFAFEDPILFSMSARENLLLGGPDATEEEIRRALETAHAGFALELPWGLDTRIGEQGYSLSGGQRQRLALARAVIGAPSVLVLDDPLSAVDVHTEAQIEAALRSVLSGVTALLVVHRPSTLALADRVALLDGGTIVASGTHKELLGLALYRDILSQEAEEVAR